MPQCVVCQGTEFVKEEGFYYCSECQTRCQGEVEQVHEVTWVEESRHEQKTKITSTPKITVDDDDWTTWEAYNYVLKGMVDELISLGASPNLKIIVFQLWARYLRGIEVAFLGTQRNFPKLGPLYTERDARVLYSWPSENRTKKSDKSNNSLCSGEASLTARTRAKARAKKALATAEQDRRSLASSVTSETSCLTTSGIKLQRKNKYMTEEAFHLRQIKKMKAKSPKHQPWKSKVRVRTTQSTYLCKAKLLAIIHLGVLLSGDDIQLSDLIRWIFEGHLSYCSVTHFLPAKMVVKGKKDLRALEFKNSCPNHSTVRKVGGQLVSMLGIKSLPSPHLPDLIHRYVNDLELPEELADLAINIWADCRPKMPMKSELKAAEGETGQKTCGLIGQEIPNYEGRAMAIIIFAIKLIFCLDGHTELMLSNFARKANKILKLGSGTSSLNLSETHNTSQNLFVWQDWVNYVEFRDSLISRWHYPTHASRGPENIQLSLGRKNTIPESPPSQDVFKYLGFCQQSMKYKIKKIERKKDPEWFRFMVNQLESMTQEISPPSGYNKIFEPSITPRFSYMQTLRKEYMTRGIVNQNELSQNGPCPKLLSAQFGRTSIAYLLDPTAITEALAKENVEVDIIKGSAMGKRGSKFVKFIEPIRSYGENSRSEQYMNVKITRDNVGVKRKTFDLFQFGDKYKLLEQLQTKENKCTSVTLKQKKLNRTDPLPNKCKTHEKSKNIRKKSQSKEKSKSVSMKSKSLPLKTAGTIKKRLTLMMPYRQVWLLYGVFHDMPEVKFDDLCSRMPSSFNWLLRLCANMIEMSEVSLYSELVNVELVHKYFRKVKGTKIEGHRYEHLRTNVALAVW